MGAWVGYNHKVRKALETFRACLFLSVPVLFGYGLGRIPEFWEAVERWNPSAASNPLGPYLPQEITKHRPTLQSEWQALALEAALDEALKEVRDRKAKKAAAANPAL